MYTWTIFLAAAEVTAAQTTELSFQRNHNEIFPHPKNVSMWTLFPEYSVCKIRARSKLDVEKQAIRVGVRIVGVECVVQRILLVGFLPPGSLVSTV